MPAALTRSVASASASAWRAVSPGTWAPRWTRARLLYLPAGCRLHEVSGFEAGPCSAFLDTLMRQVRGGNHSRYYQG